MAIFRVKRLKDPFVRFSKSIVMDKRLSWKAKGILTYAFSRPEDWSFYKKEMEQHASDGEKSLDSGLKELHDLGYLHKKPCQDSKTGKMEGWEWFFFEVPVTKEEFSNISSETPILGPTEKGGDGISPKTVSENPDVPTYNTPTKKESSKQEAAAANPEIQEKIELLKKSLPSFNPSQAIALCKQESVRLSDLEKALTVLKTRKNIKNPISFLTDCVEKRYWEENPEELNHQTLWDSLKTALRLLRERNGNKMALTTKDDYYCVSEHLKASVEIEPRHMESESTIKALIEYINNHFGCKKKIMYVKLPGKTCFEVEE